MRKRKQPPTSTELLEKFKLKCPGLPDDVYQHVHDAILDARTTVALAKAEFLLENEKEQNDGDQGLH